MKKNIRRSLTLFLAGIVTAGSVSACGGKSSSQNMIAETAAAAVSYDSAPMAGGVFSGSMMDKGYYEEGAAYEDAWEEDIPMETAAEPTATMAAPGGNPTDFSGTDSSAARQANARKLIRTVSLDVETTDFDNLLADIRQTISAQNGYIEQSDVSGTSISASSDRNRYAYLVVRIPSDKLDGFVSRMGEKGNITNRSENVQDVTLQYTDIESRKKSLTIEQERLWELLEKADTLEAVIALEERLSEIRYQLENFESQLRTYDNQVDYSTVHVNIREVTVFTPTVPDSVGTRIQKGFVRNLNHVGNTMVDFVVWFLSHLPALVLLSVLAGLISVVVIKCRKRRKAKEPKKKSFIFHAPKTGDTSEKPGNAEDTDSKTPEN